MILGRTRPIFVGWNFFRFSGSELLQIGYSFFDAIPLLRLREPPLHPTLPRLIVGGDIDAPFRATLLLALIEPPRLDAGNKAPLLKALQAKAER